MGHMKIYIRSGWFWHQVVIEFNFFFFSFLIFINLLWILVVMQTSWWAIYISDLKTRVGEKKLDDLNEKFNNTLIIYVSTVFGMAVIAHSFFDGLVVHPIASKQISWREHAGSWPTFLFPMLKSAPECAYSVSIKITVLIPYMRFLHIYRSNVNYLFPLRVLSISPPMFWECCQG
jgi:hypothetical protein